MAGVSELVRVLLLLVCCIPAFSWAQEQLQPVGSLSDASSYKSDYSRVHEAQKQCPFPSSFAAQEQGPDPSWVIENELSFRNGDWFQKPNAKSSMILPFSDSQNTELDLFQLVSFWITDVNLRGSSGAVRVSATLAMAITKERNLDYYTRAAESFENYDGFSLTTMLLEGVYFETGTERGVCMVGCRPVVGDSGKYCDVYLELHYPLRLSLLSREIHGFLRSTSSKQALSFFDRVEISSQLGPYSTYQFDDGSLLKPACKPSLQQMPPKGIQVYKKDRFCSVLMQALPVNSRSWIRLLAPGPFPNTSKLLQIGDIRCIDYQEGDLGNQNFFSNVSVVFRAASKNQSLSLMAERSALDELSLAAEGIYNSRSGELCMLACFNSSRSSCTVRVSVFVPLTFSITQRDVLFGTFNSLVMKEDAFAPSKFGLSASLRNLPRELSDELRYAYTLINEAITRAEQDELQTSLKERLKASLLKFPGAGKKIRNENLGMDLTVTSLLINSGSELISSRSAPSPMESSRSSLELEVLMVEDHTVWGSWGDNSSSSSYPEEAEKLPLTVGDGQQLFRVAVQVSFTGDNSSLPQISGEGVYSPKTGKMHLLGCRNSVDESQRDCNVSVVVQYPPKNSQWLVSPTLIMTISSTLNSFGDIKLQTFPILYSEQLREILSRKTLESILSAFTLSLMVVCIVLQLRHVNKSRDSAPFISLVMLAVHAFGYSIPLITGAEALFARLTSGSSSLDPVEEERQSVIGHSGPSDVVLYLVKLLSLAAFLLMLRLCQRVIRARIRLATKFPLEPRRAPGEWKTLQLFMILHLAGFLTVLMFHYVFRSLSNEALFASASAIDWDGQQQKPERDWIKEMKEYTGLVEDLFLLPQVIGGSIWEIKGKPLRPAYYMGITALRLLPHAYSAVSKPLFNPFYADEASVFANPKMDFYTRVGDLVIPLLAIGLAGVVYAQQRWNGLRLGSVLRQGSSKLMRYGSKLYERLPSSSGGRAEESKNFEMMPSNEESAA